MYTCIVRVFVLFAVMFLALPTGCDCGDDSDDKDCAPCFEQPDDDDSVDDYDSIDDDSVDDDDDVSELAFRIAEFICHTTASYLSGEYYQPIRVTLSSNCDGEIFYKRERADGSGDTVFNQGPSPINDIYIDRDTTLRFFSVNGMGLSEAEKIEHYDFPPKFRGIMSAYAGDEQAVLQWGPAWDEDLPITYNIYQPSNDSPIPTLNQIASTDQEMIVIDDSILDLTNGQVDCFVVRAQDATGMEELNYVGYCLNPQPVFYVDAAASDGGDGSIGTPFNSIQAANDAMPSTRYFTNIYVAGGTYGEALDFTLNDPPYTAHNRSAQITGGFDPSDWVRDLGNQISLIDPDGASVGWAPGEQDLIDGFAITNANAGMKFMNRMSITIRNCLIYGNDGSGILIQGSDLVSGPSITSSLIVGNSVGINLIAQADTDSDSGVSVLLRNLIVYDNSSVGIFIQATGDGAFDTVANARIRNTIIASNEHGLQAVLSGDNIDSTIEVFNDFIGNNGADLACSACAFDPFFIEFSDILDPDIYTGFGLINELPAFLDSPYDFNLAPWSPLVDTGSPDVMFNDPDTTRNDIGAFGGVGGSWDPMPHFQ